MKSYPSITTKIDFDREYVVFDKLDGSNIRAEWNEKSGFYKFGSRTQLLSEQQVNLYPSIEKIKAKYGEELEQRLKAAKIQRAVCFFEYYGPNSFAGSHPDSTDGMDAVLIDIDVYKKGILCPETFLELTSGLDTPRVLHSGIITKTLIDDIRHSRIRGMALEGVVAKTINNGKKPPHMCKIKSIAWLDKLRMFCNNDEKLFNILK